MVEDVGMAGTSAGGGVELPFVRRRELEAIAVVEPYGLEELLERDIAALVADPELRREPGDK